MLADDYNQEWVEESEAKASLFDLIARLEADGGEIVVSRNGRAIARLVAVESPPTEDDHEMVESFEAIRQAAAQTWRGQDFELKTAIEDGRA